MRSLSTKLFLLIAVPVTSLVGLSVYLKINGAQKAIRLQAEHMAGTVANQVITDRKHYVQAVVSKLKGTPFAPREGYEADSPHVPLPATFVMGVAEDVSESQSQYRYGLVSKWNINPGNELKDDFLKRGFENLMAQESEAKASGELTTDQAFNDWEPFSEVVQVDGRRVLRYLSVDVAVDQTCVSCHNKLEQRDDVLALRKQAGVEAGRLFELNDLMGAVAVEVSLDEAGAVAMGNAWASLSWLLAAGGLAIGLPVMFLRRSITNPIRLITVDLTERKKAEERFQQVVEACPSALVMVNSDGVILLVNGETERMFGYDRGELLGQKVEVLVPSGFRAQHPQQRRQYFDAPVPRAMGSNKDLFAVRKDGSEFPVEIGLNPIQTEKGLAVLSAIVDITERKKSQESLNHYAAELKRSNDELDQFAYVASHDLKAPLRGLDNVSAWIVEDLGDEVPEKTRGHLQKMRQRVKRMEMLLDDLLSYSRAGRVKGDIKQVDVGELVKDVTQLLALPEGITVEMRDPLPTLTAHKVPLELVFRNLIGNAVKHHDRPDGRVDISAHVNGTFVEFIVADDGPGIASKYHERIFDMFKTLRPRDQVEGSGMGLAVVKKTIESQGGSITVDSDGTRGTQFRFTWPKTVIT